MIVTLAGEMKTGVKLRSSVYLGNSQFKKKWTSFLIGVFHRALNKYMNVRCETARRGYMSNEYSNTFDYESLCLLHITA